MSFNLSTRLSKRRQIKKHQHYISLLRGTATGWTTGVLGFDSRRGLGLFLITTASRTALGPTQPPIEMGTTGSIPGGKATGA